MSEPVIDYRSRDPFEDRQNARAAKLGKQSIFIFLGQVTVAILDGLFGPGPYSPRWPMIGSILCCVSITGIVLAMRALWLHGKNTRSWFGFLLNVIFVIYLAFASFMHYLLSHLET